MTDTTTTAKEAVKQELDTLSDKNVDSTDSDVRYMAYGARLRTALRAGHRYIAYVRRAVSASSDTDTDRTMPRPVTLAKPSGQSSHPRS